ncbi:gluconeogenesis factor YvcK family protein [Listeria fleischmannii]|uniref:Gluconeogenesis factor n=1 Tax=Listeria fleischmannii TaxID=1069827 RepID=A0A841YE82_9LIST|nr:YvcK family protein [Listeria fleischmannii]MBC1398540.1 YvcK family protein [Listeria fleischmannii]MBC1426601.1 YvcK family protein [Listeria fleischmannii]
MDKAKKPKIVVIGGGTGIPVILKGLKNKNVDLTALVTVADDGGSSGKIRQQMNVLPPGDIRNVMVALSNADQRLVDLFQYRFKVDGDLSGHVVGNLILTALSELNASYVDAIDVLSKVMRIRGKVIPVTDHPLVLKAEMEDGEIVTGESIIPLQGKQIKRVFIEPEEVLPLKTAIRAVKEADLIVIGPGSLYTSIMPNLLVKGLADAILASNAEKVYITNILTQIGETDYFSDADHIRAIHEHVGTPFITKMLINTEKVPEELLFPDDVRQVTHSDADLKKIGVEEVYHDFLSTENRLVRHDGEKVAQALLEMLSNENEKE